MTDFYESAKQIVCSIIAVGLSMGVAAVEALLPHRPDWLERVHHLAIRLHSLSSARQAAPGSSADNDDRGKATGDSQTVDTESLLRAYGKLWEFVHDLRSEGLSLDDSFCERVEREWSVTALLTYMRNADKALQEHAAKALDAAAESLAQARGRRPV